MLGQARYTADESGFEVDCNGRSSRLANGIVWKNHGGRSLSCCGYEASNLTGVVQFRFVVQHLFDARCTQSTISLQGAMHHRNCFCSSSICHRCRK